MNANNSTHELVGIVKDVDDPKQMRRIRAFIPALGMKEGELSLWIYPCLEGGREMLPALESAWWIRFQNGDFSKGVYIGEAVTKDSVSQDFLDNYSPTYRRDYDENGNVLEWSEEGMKLTDANGSVVLLNGDGISVEEFNGNSIVINGDGVNVSDANGNALVLNGDGVKVDDANGNTLSMESGKVVVNGNYNG